MKRPKCLILLLSVALLSGCSNAATSPDGETKGSDTKTETVSSEDNLVDVEITNITSDDEDNQQAVEEEETESESNIVKIDPNQPIKESEEQQMNAIYDEETDTVYEQSENANHQREVEILPMYFKENFKNIETSSLDVSAYGDKNICLSEIYSYITDNASVEVEYFDLVFQDYLPATGIADDGLCEQMVSGTGWTVDKTVFDAETVFTHMQVSSSICLLHINHPSIYGTNAAYLVLTGLSFEDPVGVIVRDPNQKSVEKNAVGYNLRNEPVYSMADIIGAASDDSECWIFYQDDRTEEEKDEDYYYKRYTHQLTGEEGVVNE